MKRLGQVSISIRLLFFTFIFFCLFLNNVMKESSFAPESSLPSAETISLTLNHICVNFLLNHIECGLFVVIYA